MARCIPVGQPSRVARVPSFWLAGAVLLVNRRARVDDDSYPERLLQRQGVTPLERPN
jgi:hypothetical protein